MEFIAHMITKGYYLSIAQEYPWRVHGLGMIKRAEQNAFDRILSRLHEKWPNRYPPGKLPTQRQVAALAGVSQPSVHKWRAGGPIDPTNLRDLAVKLDVAVEWLTTGRGPKFPGPANEPLLDTLWVLATRMDELQRMELVRYANYISEKRNAAAG